MEPRSEVQSSEKQADRWLKLAADLVIDPDRSVVLRVKSLTFPDFHLGGTPVEMCVEGLGLPQPVLLGGGSHPLLDPGAMGGRRWDLSYTRHRTHVGQLGKPIVQGWYWC